MGFIIADADMKEIGVLRCYMCDFDIGRQNDFYIRTARDEGLAIGQYVFMPGTEYGGRIEYLKSTLGEDGVVLMGTAWRGLLKKDVVEPFHGDSHRTVSGFAHGIIRTVLNENNSAGTIFTVPQSASIDIPTYSFDRYTTKLKGFSKMLDRHGHRLHIEAVKSNPGGAFTIEVSAMPIIDYSDEIEFSVDQRVTATIEDNRMGINRLICLGRGELAERERLDLCVDKDGEIYRIENGIEPYFKGLDMRTEVYPNPNVEDEAELERYGRERLEEIKGGRVMTLTVEDFPVEIGDIVGGRDREAEIYLAQPVTGLIFSVRDEVEKIEISVEGGYDDYDDEDY